MSVSYQQSAYQETGIISSSPERLVPVLYEHLLVKLKRASTCIAKSDFEGKFDNLSKASDIIAELLSALDFEAGGELADRLSALYGFWLREISIAGRDLSPERLIRVSDMVVSLLEAGEEAARLVEGGEGVAQRPEEAP